MDEEVATRLLQKCLIDQELVKERHDTTALLTELTYLPLAIIQAAAYMNENRITIAEYLSLGVSISQDTEMLRRGDVKGSNRREGAKANTAEKLGNDGSAGPRQRQGPNRLHVISRSSSRCRSRLPNHG
jgi:hypothetical protein